MNQNNKELVSETRHTKTYCDDKNCDVYDKYNNIIIDKMTKKKYNSKMTARIKETLETKTKNKRRN